MVAPRDIRLRIHKTRRASVLVAVGLALIQSACCSLGLGRTEPIPEAEIAEHIKERRDKYGPGFTVLSAPPFVVVGDGPRKWVEEDTDSVVRVAAKLLKGGLFKASRPV